MYYYSKFEVKEFFCSWVSCSSDLIFLKFLLILKWAKTIRSTQEIAVITGINNNWYDFYYLEQVVVDYFIDEVVVYL